ncbi:MAG: glycosyltransferase family 4 protein [Proteobacteria bacterium]|nr:glycosyltransferase family 4 protein [Pseudomonadota bacterium]
MTDNQIIHVAAGLGQGGVETSIELLATAPCGPPGQRVIGLDCGGATAERLAAAGVEVSLCDGEVDAAASKITGLGEAVVLLHRAGRPEATWHRLSRSLRDAPGVVIIDFNVFGWVDRAAIRGGVKGVFCISGTALAKYLRLYFGRVPTAEEIASLPVAVCAGNYPVLATAPPDHTAKAHLRQELGLPAEARIAIRVGRPDPRKWSDLLIIHGARLLADIPDLHLVFLSAPESRRRVISRLLGGRATFAPFVTDRIKVERYLAAADVMLHYARYGESFGYALAEAQVMRLPVVVHSTPWGDNAQREVVRHGKTGFVASRYGEILLYLQWILADPALAARLGEAGRTHVCENYGLEPTWGLLSAFISHVRNGDVGLLKHPEPIGASQAERLALGMQAYDERFPILTRLAAEAPLYRAPWYYPLLAGDAVEVITRRIRNR